VFYRYTLEGSSRCLEVHVTSIDSLSSRQPAVDHVIFSCHLFGCIWTVLIKESRCARETSCLSLRMRNNVRGPTSALTEFLRVRILKV
jgi:hypothetical protein